MNILAFDTSSTACTVALLHGKEIQAAHQIAPMQQAQLLLPMIQQLLDTASLTLAQLDAIAFGCGPGSFTGIRIASSVAQGLAFAASLPVIPVSSLAVMAQAAREERQWDKLLVAVDARMEQVYWAVYEANKAGHVALIGQESVGKPQDIPIPPDSLHWHGIGDGWEKYAEKLIEHLGFQPETLNPSQLPSAKALLTLAKMKFEQGDYTTAFYAFPAYLR